MEEFRQQVVDRTLVGLIGKAEKLLLRSLSSDKLGLQGAIDCIIKTEAGEYVPVDYKGRVWVDHKYQLTAYAMLIEENYQTRVRRGFINYLPEKRVIQLEVPPAMKIHVKRILGHIKSMITQERLPPIR